MVTTFTDEKGETLSPKNFAVYIRKDGSSFKKIKDVIDEGDLDDYENIKRVDLYENGTENLAPTLIDSVGRN